MSVEMGPWLLMSVLEFGMGDTMMKSVILALLGSTDSFM